MVSKVVPLAQVSPSKPCIRLSFPHKRYMPNTSPTLFYHTNNIGWTLRDNYAPQHVIISTPLLP